MEIEHGYAAGDGVRLHFARAGIGPAMVFCHGFPEYWRAWAPALRSFGRDHLAIAPDLRGYNLSDKPAAVRDYRIERAVADLKALAAALGVARFTLVGHDWGGALAWAFAIRHPEMVERLVVINAPHPVAFARALADDPAQQAASAYIRRFRRADAEAGLAAGGFAGLWRFAFGDIGAEPPFTPEERRAYREAWRQPGALTGMLNWYRASPLRPPAADGRDGPPSLDPARFRVTVPTLAVWGMADRALLPGLLDGLAEHVADLRVVRVPDAGHWIVHERPLAVERAIRAFLAEPPARPTA